MKKFFVIFVLLTALTVGIFAQSNPVSDWKAGTYSDLTLSAMFVPADSGKSEDSTIYGTFGYGMHTYIGPQKGFGLTFDGGFGGGIGYGQLSWIWATLRAGGRMIFSAVASGGAAVPMSYLDFGLKSTISDFNLGTYVSWYQAVPTSKDSALFYRVGADITLPWAKKDLDAVVSTAKEEYWEVNPTLGFGFFFDGVSYQTRKELGVNTSLQFNNATRNGGKNYMGMRVSPYFQVTGALSLWMAVESNIFNIYSGGDQKGQTKMLVSGGLTLGM